MAAGRGSIATSSRVSCIRLTTDATPTTKPVPSFGSRRPLPRIRTEILRRTGRNARAVVGRPPALPDAPSAVVHSLAADRYAALSQKATRGRWGRRMGRAKRNPSPSAPALMGIASLHPSYRTPANDGVSRRRLRDVVFAREQMNQRALDRGLPGRRVDLGAEQIRHV